MTREQDAALERAFARFARIGLVLPRNRPAPPADGRSLVAANLRRLRAERHIAQEALAALAGLDRSYVGRVERAEVNVSIDNICLLASALSVEPSTLLARH